MGIVNKKSIMIECIYCGSPDIVSTMPQRRRLRDADRGWVIAWLQEGVEVRKGDRR